LQIQKRAESKLLDRTYIELSMEGKAGKITRKEAIAALAKELSVPEENVGLLRIEELAGTTSVVGKFYVYGSAASKKRVHPKYLDVRILSKEEREKLKQEKKKAAAPAPAPEAKK